MELARWLVRRRLHLCVEQWLALRPRHDVDWRKVVREMRHVEVHAWNVLHSSRVV